MQADISRSTHGLFPANWTTVDSENGPLICGISCDPASIACAVYVSDLERCFCESLTREEIVARARGEGIEDLRQRDLEFLLSGCQQAVDSGAAKIGCNTLEWTVETKDPVEWTFRLHQASVESTASFFRKLNSQNFQREALLLHRINRLHLLLEVRDYYIMFLTQNLRSINGDEVLAKFQRNFKDHNGLLLLKKEDWAEWSEQGFHDDDVWKNVRMITESPTKLPSKREQTKVKSEPDSPTRVKRERNKPEGTMGDSALKRKRFKKEDSVGAGPEPTFELKSETTLGQEENATARRPLVSPKKLVKRLGQIRRRR